MKKLMLLAALISGSAFADVTFDLHMIVEGKETRKQIVMDAESKVWHTALEEDFVFLAKINPDGENAIIIEMNVFKKNEKGEHVLVSAPKIATEWAKPAEIRFLNKTEAGEQEVFALRVIANK